MKLRLILVLAAVIAQSGCAAVPRLSRVGETLPPGQWGGDQIALHVSVDGRGQVELSCASAEFAGPVKLDVGGHFLTTGRFVRGTGVATRQRPVPVAANIGGRLDRDGTLWLDIALRDSYPVRSARLRPGVQPKFLRCL